MNAVMPGTDSSKNLSKTVEAKSATLVKGGEVVHMITLHNVLRVTVLKRKNGRQKKKKYV